MENFWVIVTLIVTIIFMLVTFYYSYTAKRELEKKLEATKAELAMSSRPLVVMRAVDHEGASSYEAETPEEPKIEQSGALRPKASHFSHFELYNAGSGPAIDLEISLMNKEKVVLQSQSVGFLRNNEPALPFVPVKLDLDQTYYLVAEYESIRSRARQNPVWYQTRLPFLPLKCSDKKEINISVGDLDFKEASLAERINAFPTAQKPQ
jgi:hypothetical protein